jgi:4-amino-4-deoxy-L-arabinose transferase-like glycosyltransferase
LAAAVVAVTVLAAVLRLVELGQVPNDPFYDAAVRSMGLSWHNFFFGAFEPAGSVSIDKPPLDLWLQVASTELLGFGSAALKLPQALAGTAAVPLLFAAVRRPFGAGAALIAALALAVMPVSVLTARSDTMDTVMMTLVVLALAGVVTACHTGRIRWLYAAAAVLGLAFNVKLLEALIPVPALAAIALLGLPHPVARRIAHVAAGASVMAAVSLSWLTVTLLFPAHDRPFAIGSTNGSAWNAAFVFNGYDRIVKPARADRAADSGASRAPPRSSTGQRLRPGSELGLDHVPIRPPSATRLLDRAGPLSGRRFGFVLLAALLLGLPALALAARGRRRAPPAHTDEHPDTPKPAQADQPTHADEPPDAPKPAHADGPPDAAPLPQAGESAHADERVRRAAAVGVGLWLLGGTVLFSAMARLHPRYVEAYTPAVAVALGVGVAWAVRGGGARRVLLAATAIALAAYGWYLKDGPVALVWVTAIAGAGAVWAAGTAPRRARALNVTALAGSGAAWAAGTAPRRARTLAATALACVAIFALPMAAAIALIANHETDAGHVGAMPADEVARLSAYLRAHRGNARYEVAVSSATQAGALIVHDRQPVLVLTTYDGRTLVSGPRLARLVAGGQVRFALLGGRCHPGDPATAAQCSSPGRWILAHGADISTEARLRRSSLLWRLPTR